MRWRLRRGGYYVCYNGKGQHHRLTLILLACRKGRGSAEAEETAHELGAIAVEGLARLAMHQGQIASASLGQLEDAEACQANCLAVSTSHIAGWDRWRVLAQIMVRLLEASCNPATEHAEAVRQCLSVFLPAYAAVSTAHRRTVAAAALRAARRLLPVRPSPAANAAAPGLLRYVGQLLQVQRHVAWAHIWEQHYIKAVAMQVPSARRNGDDADWGAESLAESCLNEVLICAHVPAAKPYVGGLLKLLLSLPLSGLADSSLMRLRVLTGKALLTWSLISCGSQGMLTQTIVGMQTKPRRPSRRALRPRMPRAWRAACLHWPPAHPRWIFMHFTACSFY